MNKKISLTVQINKEIGNRVLFCSVAFLIIIFGLTIYDVFSSVMQLRSRINEQVKPIEDFAIHQAFINNLDTIPLKIDSFNENNPSFQIEWVRQGMPLYKKISWRFPFAWIYDYRIDEITEFPFGYFRITGKFSSDKTLLYDLLFRLILFMIFTISVLGILYPLAKKIPEQLFINPINHFIDLISNNPIQSNEAAKSLPAELEILETKILALLKTATEHERNKVTIELGHLSARLAHDIHSPLTAMEMGLHLITKKIPHKELTILTNGIRSVRDIANNILERYRYSTIESNISTSIKKYDDGNIIRPILLFSVLESIVSQKKHEWHQQPCEIKLEIKSDSKFGWLIVSPNEIKRHLSNLLNNAYDAITDKQNGNINLLLDNIEKKLTLKLNDNGEGIPPDKIYDVLNGLSLKHNGQGLGLSGAKQYVESLGGKFELSSSRNQGTNISLTFPMTTDIPWFTDTILLYESSIVVVLDDDFSMLMYWEQRLSEAGFTPKLFLSYENASQWVENNQHLISSTIFIADYELSEDNSNGLIFLEKVSHKNNCYLITSHAEEVHLQREALIAGVWLIPKSLSNHINFTIYTSSQINQSTPAVHV